LLTALACGASVARRVFFPTTLAPYASAGVTEKVKTKITASAVTFDANGKTNLMPQICRAF